MPTNENANYVMYPFRTAKEEVLPSSGIFLVNPSDFEAFRRDVMNESWKRRSLFNSNLFVDERQDLFVAGPSIGAPMAVMTLEKLIALGAKKITLFGWGGGLQAADRVGDLVVVERCVAGEGTSGYYLTEKVLPMQTEALSELGQVLNKNDMVYRKGICWSTDAPYREEKNYLKRLISEFGVDIIDMETSALNTVSTFRGIELSALLMISDLPLDKNWRMSCNDKGFKNKVRELVHLLCGN